MSTAITQETFDGLAFPVIRVKYDGPTDYRPSRWIATLRRDNDRSYRVSQSYDDGAPEGARNAIGAAMACWERARADLGVPQDEHLAVPGALDANTYAFLMVPRDLLGA